MANAGKDQNNVSTKLAILNTDGNTIVPIKANATDHGLKVSDGTTGTDHGPKNVLRDQNFVPTMCALSNADGKTVVPLYATNLGELLIKST